MFPTKHHLGDASQQRQEGGQGPASWYDSSLPRCVHALAIASAAVSHRKFHRLAAVFATFSRFIARFLGTKIQPEVLLTEVFFHFPRVTDVRAFGSWISTPKCLFFQDFEGLAEAFAPRRPPGYPRGRPRDIWPQNLLFGLLFRS